LAINAGGVVVVYQSSPQRVPARAIPELNADGAWRFTTTPTSRYGDALIA